MPGVLIFIYGVSIIAILYFILEMIYSVYYTPGETVIYNSPQAQKLFPGAKNKLFPTWGYTKQGLYKGDPTKYGQGQFWPESGQGYVPNKFGSGGPSPSGGMRPTLPIPDASEVGYWGNAPEHPDKVHLDIYDSSSQHVEYVTPIGHWDN
jgi:hypothetical protein